MSRAGQGLEAASAAGVDAPETYSTPKSVLWRRAFGKPDGWFIRLRCWVLGHDEVLCFPECCNSVWCERCLARLREIEPCVEEPVTPKTEFGI